LGAKKSRRGSSRYEQAAPPWVGSGGGFSAVCGGLLAGQGVVFVDEALQALLQDVGVDFGGRDIGMAEELLDGAQVGAPVEQVAGEGVA
jgi:hypothetical protein